MGLLLETGLCQDYNQTRVTEAEKRILENCKG
jgi:hypothetical protein